MEVPCIPTERGALWLFLAMGFLAHARGVVLLLREARLWWLKKAGKIHDSEDPN